MFQGTELNKVADVLHLMVKEINNCKPTGAVNVPKHVKIGACVRLIEAILEHIDDPDENTKLDDPDFPELKNVLRYHYDDEDPRYQHRRAFGELKLDPRELFIGLYESISMDERTKDLRNAANAILMRDRQVREVEAKTIAARNEILAEQLVASGMYTRSRLPKEDFGHGVDENGRPAYPVEMRVSIPVFVSVPELLAYPAVGRYSHAKGEWFVMGVGGMVRFDQVVEWWPIPEAGTGFKQHPIKVK